MNKWVLKGEDGYLVGINEATLVETGRTVWYLWVTFGTIEEAQKFTRLEDAEAVINNLAGFMKLELWPEDLGHSVLITVSELRGWLQQVQSLDELRERLEARSGKCT